MKRKIIYLLGVVSLLILSACESLDLEVRTSTSKEEVAGDYGRTKSQCVALYGVLSSGFNSFGGGMMASASDEAEHSVETYAVQMFNTGSWNEIVNPNDVWGKYYRGIRLANDFLAMSGNVNLDIYRLDPTPSAQQLYQTRLAEIKNWKYEARFLRSYFYFELFKRYGSVPIIKEVLPLDYDYAGIQRSSLSDLIKYMADECDSAASVLPATYTVDADHGRATKGAALALKSRILLYAASDLFNNPSWAGGYAHPEYISVTSDRTAQWQAAANAAKAVIDMSGVAGYSLLTSYTGLFQGSYNNTELIFARREAASNFFEIASFPIGFDLATGGTTPSGNLVDAFEVKIDANTAAPFDWNNPVHAANPYANRDPRLLASVIVNGSTYKGRVVECWAGGKDGPGIPQATRTGYYLKKYSNETLDLLQNKTSVHTWALFRLAEVYLNYAEALNEASPGHADILTYLNKVRQRAGVAMPAIPSGLSQPEMREKIRHERQVELAFEEHRFWDLRRWMTAETNFSMPLKGVAITNNSGVYSYVPVVVENRIFDKKMYLYPIPQAELNICKGLEQNPLW